MATGRFVSYLRVSTQKQGKSGLGLEAQRASVENFLNGGSWQLLREFVEVESGKRQDNRPVLAEALHYAKLTGATLVIAKLDRLSRNLAFIATLQDSGAKFIAADMPQANESMVQFMAVMAQAERQAISTRTKEALAAAKQRLAREGKRLGNPHGAEALRRAGKGNTAAIAAAHEASERFARELAPVIEDIRQAGIVSLKAIARELNSRGILTARGGAWHPTTVKNLLARQ
jgi:DNA invertase Pin-like site-specific DNA recombinase